MLVPVRLEQGFDLFKAAYAKRAENLSVSEVRALFATVSRPEVVSLAGGMPDVSALDNDLIRTAFDSLMANRSQFALQYGPGQGDAKLREQILEIMELEGIAGAVENLMVTTGSQHALELLADLFLDQGDVALVESPSYVGAVGVFRHKEAHIEHVYTDGDGISPEAVAEAADRMAAEGKQVKLLYLVTNFANPSGVTLSEERRDKLIAVCKGRGILIIEDNPYGLLYFDAPPPRALRARDADSVVYLGSFSKILSPGLRVGYVLAPPAIKDKLILANESAVLSPATFAQMLISEYLSICDWQKQIANYRGLYKTKKEAAIWALSEYLPELETTKPSGGFFLWVSLPSGLDGKEMLPTAVEELVAYTPGTAFYGDGRGKEFIRICYSHPTVENVKVGIQRLARAIERSHEN
jgi:DNA-binding transcriptional MocR family regulator